MDAKFFLRSKTILGALIALVATVLSMFGVRLDESLTLGYANEIIALLGTAFAIYGRVKANSPITMLPKPSQSGQSGRALPAMLSLVLALSLLTLLACQGCTDTRTALERAREASATSLAAYKQVHAEVVDALANPDLPPQARVLLLDRVDPMLNKARTALTLAGRCVLVWEQADMAARSGNATSALAALATSEDVRTLVRSLSAYLGAPVEWPGTAEALADLCRDLAARLVADGTAQVRAASAALAQAKTGGNNI